MTGFMLNMNFATIEPDEGGMRRYFPVSDSRGWLCHIVDNENKETSDKQGTRLVLALEGLEGAVQGKFHDHGLNVLNKSQDAVRISQAQLSAIAHCIGTMQVGNITEMFRKPFRVVIVLDDKNQENYPGSTKIAKFLDINGNGPKQAGQGAIQSAATGFNGGAQQGGFGGQQQGGFQGNQQGGFGNQAQAPQGSDQAGAGFGNGAQQGQNTGGFQGAGAGFNPNAQGGGFGGGQQQQGQQQGGFGGQQQGGFQGGGFQPQGGAGWGQQ